MNYYFAYIRVSTARQGEGVSLQEQRDAILRYAEQHALVIGEWFEEQQTAAKRGRPCFTRMMTRLIAGQATGVIIHKIDRSARNLKDWADVVDLVERDIDVHIAHEALDLRSRGGRLTADIQAVIATDYIRNLRDEARKGIYGRLKQGVYPRPAPLGYSDVGPGRPKVIDPVAAPFVRLAFELYATRRYGLDDLAAELNRHGLRTKTGKLLRPTALSDVLNNPFYVGVIRLKRTGETFAGAHEPLITKALFERVQRILRGKTQGRTRAHEFLFRRLLTCQHCRYSLIGERQKGRVYYRCHTPTCRGTSVREDTVEAELAAVLQRLQFSDAERAYFATHVPALRESAVRDEAQARQALELRLKHVTDRLSRLTDAYLDAVLARDELTERKMALLMERREIEDQLGALNGTSASVADRLTEFLELAGCAYLAYKRGLLDEKREIVASVTSNRVVDGKIVVFTLALPFNEVAQRAENQHGGAHRGTPRTCRAFLDKLAGIFRSEAIALPTVPGEVRDSGAAA